VSLSELGRARSAAAEKNGDIDDSDLPDEIKQTLKLIRQLKAQIAARQGALRRWPAISRSHPKPGG
jgi:hypothetical protein